MHTEHIPKLGWFEWLFVTPSNHRVHHAQNNVYMDRNYGGLFILWDRLFGTHDDGDITQVTYGLDVADDSRGDDLAYQMSLPFRTKERK